MIWERLWPMPMAHDEPERARYGMFAAAAKGDAPRAVIEARRRP